MKPATGAKQPTRDVDRKDTTRHKPQTAGERRVPGETGQQKINTGGNSTGSFGLTRSYSMGPPSLKLPGPAMRPSNDGERLEELGEEGMLHPTSSVNAQHFNGRTASPALTRVFRNEPMTSKRTFSMPYTPSLRSAGILKRVFSRSKGPPTPAEVPLEAYREFDARRAEFFSFLDEQLTMVDEFYKSKEDTASERFDQLKEQLLLMKERQALETTIAAEERKDRRSQLVLNGIASGQNGDSQHKNNSWSRVLTDHVGLSRSNGPKKDSSLDDGKNSNKEDHHLAQARTNGPNDSERRNPLEGTSYKDAKGKLKHAMQEFYRNLDLLKSYAMLNREAFRKIVKKYDKTIQTRQTGKYMSEKVDKAWFVQNHVLESHISAVEDLYANYFEKGSHKVAANKLRVKHNLDYSPSTFRIGFLLGVGSVLGARGLAYSADLYNGMHSVQVSYLLQVSCPHRINLPFDKEHRSMGATSSPCSYFFCFA